MATRIESGRMQIASVGSVPMQRVAQQGVDYIGARAEAQGMGSMAQILDRMATYTFGEAKRLRAEEGLQFAAQNPITSEQLMAAKNGNLEPLNLGSDFSVFDRAVRKARAIELSSHFEMEGRNELTKLLSDIEAGNANSEQVSTKVSTLTEGYAKSLASVDAEAALKFRATMATHGNTVLNAAYQAEVKRAKAQRIAKFDMDFDNVTRLLEQTVAQGSWTDANGQQRSIEELADMMRSNVNNQAMILGDAALQKEYSTKFEAALREAKINAVTKTLLDDAYMENPVATLDKIRRGDLGHMSPVLQQMIVNDFEAVAKVEANFMAAVNRREQARKDQAAVVKQAGEREAVNLLEQIFPLAEGDPKRKELIAKLTDLPEGSVPLTQLKDLLSPNAEGNAAVEFNLLNGIYAGTINSSEQIWGAPGLNGQQKLRLLKTLNSEDRRDQSELDRGIARLAGIPTMPGQVTVIDPKGEEFKRLQGLRADAQQIQAEAMRDGKTLTPRQVLTQLEKNLEAKRNTEAARAARKSLEVYEKMEWINGTITRDSLPALEKKAGNDKSKQNQIRQIKRLLEQAEGN